jgi:uncharacterized 2Fe-2S/4Fe-4S cluster protein (DUF4445 family)
MPSVRFLPADSTVEVPAGTTLLAAARRAGVVIEAPCDGVGTCGKCRVRLAGGAESIERRPGRHRLSAAEETAGWVLACEALVLCDLAVELPVAAPTLQIASHGLSRAVAIAPCVRKRYDAEMRHTAVHNDDTLISLEPGDTRAALYGLAVDIGTTTLIVALHDLIDGRELATASALNPQALHAQDVLSRIRLGSTDEGLSLLQGALLAELNRLTGEVAAKAGIERATIYETVLSGNTCMLHLAAGIDPAPLGKYPYTPSLTGGCQLAAADIGLQIAPCAPVYLPPVISAYVGADLTAGIQATTLQSETRTVLLVDIGTNGEMILAHDGKLLATSTAAGPAFEGMNISCGMRAGSGAIERVVIGEEGELAVGVIDNREATGLCGSGLLDLVAELVRSGVLTAAGGFTPRGSALPLSLQQRLVQREGKPVFAVSDAVWLSRGDIRQVQLAKGAIRAGIELLLQQAQVTAAAVDAVLIAGSFGYHLRPESLITLGLLPSAFAGKIEFVGNTSKSGAAALLLNHSSRAELAAVAAGVEVLELAARPEFEKVFVAALGF